MQLNDQSNASAIRPQNKSCPAGGANKFKQKLRGQRGVIIASPSGNTDNRIPMEVLHTGFDTVALSIKASIGESLFETLLEAKERGEKERREVEIKYRGITLLLRPYGGNGYAFIASTGPDGATWFFKKPNAKDPWGIRISIGSYALAMNGLGACKAHCEHVLDNFGIRYQKSDVSLSRADVCVDIWAPTFTLNPDNFVMHGSTKRRDFVTAENVSIHGKSGRATSVTVGKINNRQVIIYDKRSEIISKNKHYWWEIWNHNLAKFQDNSDENVTKSDKTEAGIVGHFPTFPLKSEQNEIVWRIEFRAGKNLLKDRWGIRTWEHFFDKFGDLCREIGKVIKYTEPLQNDPNRARWPPHQIWEVACDAINQDLFELSCGADPNPIKEVEREEHIALIMRNILGCGITVAALNARAFKELPDAIDQIAMELKTKLKADPERAARQLNDAAERYCFVRKEKAQS